MRRPPAVARVLEAMTTTVREHQMLLPGQSVLVAVSGGPDSVCLLESLVRLRRLFKVRLEVAHVDHGLRPDSAADAAYVRRLATRHRLPFHLRTLDASSVSATAGSPEERARDARRLAIAQIKELAGADRIATAHTADDQAVTVLMRVLSGSGVDGAKGIPPVLGPWVRPLFRVRRPEVESFCRALGLRPRRDPTNEDRRLLRNAIELDVVPELERRLGRSVVEPLGRSGDRFREDARFLTELATEAVPEVVAPAPDGVDLHAVGLLDLPPPVAKRVILMAFVETGHPTGDDDVDAVLDLAAGRSGRRRDLAHGLKARRDREYVHVSRPSPGSGTSRRS